MSFLRFSFSRPQIFHAEDAALITGFVLDRSEHLFHHGGNASSSSSTLFGFALEKDDGGGGLTLSPVRTEAASAFRACRAENPADCDCMSMPRRGLASQQKEEEEEGAGKEGEMIGLRWVGGAAAGREKRQASQGKRSDLSEQSKSGGESSQEIQSSNKDRLYEVECGKPTSDEDNFGVLITCDGGGKYTCCNPNVHTQFGRSGMDFCVFAPILLDFNKSAPMTSQVLRGLDQVRLRRMR